MADEPPGTDGGGDLWLDDLSDDEIIAVTQQLVDKLYNALRPVFSGNLVLISWDRFDFGEYWKQLDYSDWDQVNFVIFTEGDVEATELLLESQLNGYMEMVERDGIEQWVLQEITANPVTHQRMLDQMDPPVQFNDIEAGVYEAIFDAIDAMRIKPKGIGVTTGHIQTEAARQLVYDRLSALAAFQD